MRPDATRLPRDAARARELGDRLGPAVSFATTEHLVLAFVGLVTFQRLMQSTLEDIAYAQRIARLRTFYVSIAPELEPFLLLVGGSGTQRPSAWQLTLTAAGMVAVVNSVVIGACVGLAATMLSGALAVALGSGAVAGALALSVHRRHQRRAFDRYTPDGIDQAAILTPADGSPALPAGSPG